MQIETQKEKEFHDKLWETTKADFMLAKLRKMYMNEYHSTEINTERMSLYIQKRKKENKQKSSNYQKVYEIEISPSYFFKK